MPRLPAARCAYVRADTVTDYIAWPNEHWIVYDSNTGQFLMTDPQGSQVVVFNPATETKVGSIAVPGAFAIDLTPDQSTAYVGTLIGDVYTIDTATLTVTMNRYVASQIGPSGFEAAEALVMADGRLALLGEGPYLSGFLAALDGFGSIAFWNPTSNSLSTYNFTNCDSSHVAEFTRSPDRTKLLIGYTPSGFCEIDESTEQDSATVTAPSPVVAISPDGNYIAFPAGAQVLLYDANTLSLIAQFDVADQGGVGFTLVFSADSKTLFVAEDALLVYAYSVADQALTGWVSNFYFNPTAGCSPCGGHAFSPNLQVTDGSGLFAGPIDEGIWFMDLSSPNTGPVSSDLDFMISYLDPNTGPTSGGTQTEWYVTSPVTTANGNSTVSSVYLGASRHPGFPALSRTTPTRAPFMRPRPQVTQVSRMSTSS